MSDPVIDEVREVRHRISERSGHDPARLVAYYMELQKQYQGRLIGGPKTEEATDLPDVERGLTAGCSGPTSQAAEPRR